MLKAFFIPLFLGDLGVKDKTTRGSGLPNHKPRVEARRAETCGSQDLSLSTNLRSGLPNRGIHVWSLLGWRFPVRQPAPQVGQYCIRLRDPQVSALCASTRGLRLGNPLRGLLCH